MIVVESDKKCIEPEIIGSYSKQVEGVRLEPAEWLLKYEHHNNLAFVYSGACT